MEGACLRLYLCGVHIQKVGDQLLRLTQNTFFSARINSFSATGNIEVFANNADSGVIRIVCF